MNRASDREKDGEPRGARSDPALAPFRGLLKAISRQDGAAGDDGAWAGDRDPLAGSEALVAELKALPRAKVPAGFTARVMEAVRGKRVSPFRRQRRWRRVRWALAAAACLALLSAASVFFVRPSAVETASAFPDADASPLEFLARTQRADGSWSDSGFAVAPQRERYGNGITSLALLAFLCRGEAGLDGANGPTVRRGVEKLVSGLDADGRIAGSDRDGEAFTQYLAAQALARAARLPGAPEAWGVAAGKAAGCVPADERTRERLSAMNRALLAGDVDAWGRVGGPAFLAAVRAIRG